MNPSLIDIIVREGKFQHDFSNRLLVETHLSYVVLGKRLAYKFKKEITYSFLDFSTLKQRKYFCEREVKLNNRFSSGVYLGVVPIRRKGSDIIIDGADGKIIDYAIKMKRLKDAKQMHVMLEHNEVTREHIKAIAVEIKNFHAHTDVIRKPFNQDLCASRFNDILSVSSFILKTLGAAELRTIEKAVHISDQFLRTHNDLFTMRINTGCIRDCHGDLHSRNIFLYAKPIIFDCIEFNDDYRRIDILDELAFFCMDLEIAGYHSLSKYFTSCYFSKEKNTFSKREQLLFTYYKCYRANVRAKVNALRAMQAEGAVRKSNLVDVQKYLALMESYLVTIT